jgi:replicative DNA helicase
MANKFYIYRFLDKDENILYIGRTNDIYRRMLKEHFTALGHLPNECYKSIDKIEYTEIENESEEVAYEAVLINRFRPVYNKQFKDEADFDINLPCFEWISFDIDKVYFDYLKNRKNKTMDISDFMKEKLYFLGSSNNSIIKTGYRVIDMHTPIGETDLILVAGDVSIGKTAYALNIAINSCLKQNKKVLYLNLKEDGSELLNRILSINTHIPLENIKKNMLVEAEIKTLAKVMERLYRIDLKFGNLTYEDKSIDNILKVIKGDSYDFIIIDDLECIYDEKAAYVKDKTLNIMQKLKSLTNDIKTPIMLLSSRVSDKIASRMDHRPVLNDIIYSSLRSFPDIIKFLYRDDLYNSDIEKQNIMDVIVAKNNTNICYITELAFLKNNLVIANINIKEEE